MSCDNLLTGSVMSKIGIIILKYAVRSILSLYILVEGSFSVSKYLQGRSTDITKLTFVETKHNERFQHPLYTICPIYEKYHQSSSNSSNADNVSSNAFLKLLIENTVYYPTINFISFLNSPSLKVNRYTTWIKTYRDVKRKEETLVQCHTFEVANNVTPGQSDGKVRYRL